MYLPGFHVGDWGKAAAVAAIVAGIVCVGEAAWIHAKAALAQALIGAAWRRELAGSARTQPWPWADTRPLARLTLREGRDAEELMVLEGASGRNLAFGPAHDPASVMPSQYQDGRYAARGDNHAPRRGFRRDEHKDCR